MKRDLKLCREILEKLERDESIENTEVIAYHLLLLGDAGYIDLSGNHLSYMRELGTKYLPKIARLTWRGHEYLETADYYEAFWKGTLGNAEASARPVVVINNRLA